MATIISKPISDVSSLKKATDYTVGETVKIPIDNVNVEFIVVNHGNPDTNVYDESCDGVWVLAKNIYSFPDYYPDGMNVYEQYNDSNIADFLALIPSNILSAIKEVRIPYAKLRGTDFEIFDGFLGLTTKAFLLSAGEVGCSRYMSMPIGSKLQYFTLTDPDPVIDSSERRATYDGDATPWYLRTPFRGGWDDSVWAVTATGACDLINSSGSAGFRPAMILPNTALFDGNNVLVG